MKHGVNQHANVKLVCIIVFRATDSLLSFPVTLTSFPFHHHHHLLLLLSLAFISSCSVPRRFLLSSLCVSPHSPCSRFQSAQTQHTFALELHTQRVWDYVGDGYVHRLLQSEFGGKMVEYKHPDAADFPGGSSGVVPEGKVEAIYLECDYLLRSQLETQRHHYETQIAKMGKERDVLRGELDTARTQVRENSGWGRGQKRG